MYCARGDLIEFIKTGHGFSSGHGSKGQLSRVIWGKCLALVVLLAIGSVWSGIKFAFEAVFFCFWLIALFGKGFINLFSRKK